MAVERGMKEANRQMLDLYTGPARFGIKPSRRDKAFILSWVAETEVQNVVWMRLIIFRLGWPPITYFDNFVSTEAGEGNRKMEASQIDKE